MKALDTRLRLFSHSDWPPQRAGNMLLPGVAPLHPPTASTATREEMVAAKHDFRPGYNGENEQLSLTVSTWNGCSTQGPLPSWTPDEKKKGGSGSESSRAKNINACGR